ncbi:MAG: pyrroloquinoline quinone precursor peptide PqqA [Waterburya sp.]
MINQTKDFSSSEKQDTSAKNINKGKNNTNSSLFLTAKPTELWRSPELEEFDLCMEVTAYVQQWE